MLMKIKYCYLFFTLFFLLQASDSDAQVLEYDIIFFIPIGKLEIEKYVHENNFATIEMNSNVKILFNQLKLFSKVISKDGEILTSEFIQEHNRDVKNHTIVFQEQDNSWTANFENGISKTFLNRPKICVSELYFEEPILVDSVFSERFGQPCYLEKVGLTIYRIHFPDNGLSDFHYKNGQCYMIKSTLRGKKTKLLLNKSFVAKQIGFDN